MVKLPVGLEAYRPRIDQILSWLPLDVHEFDKRRIAEPAPAMAYEPETYMLGFLSTLDIELIHHLMHLGYVQEIVHGVSASYEPRKPS